MSGWVKIHRSLREWRWSTYPETAWLFVYLLMEANHKDVEKGTHIYKCGTVTTSRESLAKGSGLTERQVRTSLKRLKSTNEVTIESSRQGTVIHIVNYVKYQVATNEATNERPTSDQRATSNKNERKKEGKNNNYNGGSKLRFSPPSVREVFFYFSSLKKYNLSDDVASREAEMFCNFYESKGWMVGKNKMKSWHGAASGWVSRKPEIHNTNKKKVIGF